MTWEWEGKYVCPDCDEVLNFLREDGFPEGDWKLQVHHEHDNEKSSEARWTVAVFKQWRGRKRPKEVKQMVDANAEQKRQKMKRRQVEKASG